MAEALNAGPFFDGRSLAVAHAYLAAVWRLRHRHVHPSLPGLLDLSRCSSNGARGWCRK